MSQLLLFPVAERDPEMAANDRQFARTAAQHIASGRELQQSADLLARVIGETRRLICTQTPADEDMMRWILAKARVYETTDGTASRPRRFPGHP